MHQEVVGQAFSSFIQKVRVFLESIQLTREQAIVDHYFGSSPLHILDPYDVHWDQLETQNEQLITPLPLPPPKNWKELGL